MTKKSKPPSQIERLQQQLEERLARFEVSVADRLETFEISVAARLESMQIRQARDVPDRTLPADLPPQYVAGRWKPRDGNVYGRYTYEGTAEVTGQLDSWLRRSPPATD